MSLVGSLACSDQPDHSNCGDLVSQASAAETQKQHRERVTFLAQLVETLEHLHLTTVNQARSP